MDCGSSKVMDPTKTRKKREILLLASLGSDGLRDVYIRRADGGELIEDHYSFQYMSRDDQNDFKDLFAGYSTNQILYAQEWKKDFNTKWDVFWKIGSGSKWLVGESGRDPKDIIFPNLEQCLRNLSIEES